MFEDLWPAYGDFDFNDFVVNYKIQLYMQNKNKVDAMLIGVRVKAVGGSIPYDLCLAMKGVKGGEIDQIEPYNSKNAPEAELVALNSPNYVKEPAVLKFLNIRENANRPAGAAYVNTEEGYEMPEDRLAEASFMVYFRNSIAIEDVAFDTFDFFLTPRPGIGRPPHRDPPGRFRAYARRDGRLQCAGRTERLYRQSRPLLLFERRAGLGDQYSLRHSACL